VKEWKSTKVSGIFSSIVSHQKTSGFHLLGQHCLQVTVDPQLRPGPVVSVRLQLGGRDVSRATSKARIWSNCAAWLLAN